MSRIRSWLSRNDKAVVGASDIHFVVSRDGTVSTKFVHGVEILNDSTTTMEFVVSILMNHFGMSKTSATIAVGLCHNNGGIVLPLASREQAEHMAQRLTAEARERNYPLVCRAVSAALNSDTRRETYDD
jgi:ATP-dependent Clp protease adapter protein ClpS